MVALIAGEAVAAAGALILGEYEFAGATPFIAGVLFGLAVAEVMITVARGATIWMAAWGATMAGGGILLAAWISSGRGVAPMPVMGYVAAALGAVVSGGWMVTPSRRSASRAAPQGERGRFVS
ncbi:MAG: hypothetical protein NVSMB12_10390 [Acidimicrobiales bacterium]